MKECERYLTITVWNTPKGWLGRIDDEGEEIWRLPRHLMDSGDAFDSAWREFEKLVNRLDGHDECALCSGTGLGMHDDTSCWQCGGTGVVRGEEAV